MSYSPNLPAGQATMANSSPVVIASNQSPIPVGVTGVVGLTGAVGVTGPVAVTPGSSWIVGVTGVVGITGVVPVSQSGTWQFFGAGGSMSVLGFGGSMFVSGMGGSMSFAGIGGSISVFGAGGTFVVGGTMTVVGPGAAGAAIVGNPVRVAGSDGTNTRNLVTDTAGNLFNRPAAVATATLSNVAASASSVTILSANTSRRQVVLVNDSASICYVKFGATASTTSYTVQMPAIANNQAAHLFIDEDPVYNGRIDAIWASATGNMRVTEITT